MVSNEARELNAYRIRKFKLDGFVDAFISSCFVHLRKPDADIFRLALDIAQAPARQVVYIENTPMFVQIAEGLGIRSILHTDYRSTCAKLASFGLQNDDGKVKTMSKAGDGKIGLWAVVAIGVGGMVGGGIFAVLGLAVQLAHGGTPVAFALAGVVALLTTYSYAKLSVAYPSRGGTVTFLDRAFGAGMFTGSLNVLLWLSYVVMLSLYAFAFGSYGATFLPSIGRRSANMR